MNNPIPIENVYYLLSYAWSFFREGQERNLSSVDCPDSTNLLAFLLADGISKLTKRGVDKGYELKTEETTRLRGRFDLVDSYRRATHVTGRIKCEFDEFTADTLANQILKSSCIRLAQSSSPLTKRNRARIRKSLDQLADISTIQLSGRLFRRVQLHRNNRHYRFLLNICELLNYCYMPTENEGMGRFAEVLHDEVRMNLLFEKFVLNFARRHCKGAIVRSMNITWQGTWDSEVAKVLPKMITDVTIEYPDSKTILDCKFYREALITRFERHRLHSKHLYQLMAYLQNKARHSDWSNVKGVLLYPAVDHHLNLKFELLGHEVEIRSLDLDQSWEVIQERLKAIVKAGSPRVA